MYENGESSKMKLKTKASELPFQVSSSSGLQVYPSKYNDFLKESEASRSAAIVKWYNLLFEKMPPNNQSLILLETKIGYRLFKEDQKLKGLKLSDKVQKNYDAAMRFDINGFMPTMKAFLKIAIQHEEGKEIDMKKTGKTKGTKLKTAALYLEIFQSQSKNQLTDEEIVALVKQKTGKETNSRNVAGFRCRYNQGKLDGQKGKPAKLIAVRAKDAVETKPAKLKIKKAK